ncbi:hypothetical protein KEG38_20600 [Polyangium jinanense]|uniref:hypothetical protein n=1 Tax=Polyangium jinanense TaxID=2829994 RepID=UPI0023427164|nr:hypothetical protein [Polyangium jinanense]MDC3956273.1 hypothetical protein [Polyangium jinanense]
MTTKRDLKSRIRDRMAKTGEAYAAARRNVLAGAAAPSTLVAPASSAPDIAPRPWHRLIETSADEARALLSEALRREPQLTHFGIGVYEETRKRSDAVRSGGMNPGDFMRISAEMAEGKTPLDEVLARYGITKPTWEAAQAAIDAIEHEFQSGRAALAEHLEELAACADWIKRQRPIASYNVRHTSYGYKHSVERWFDERGGPHLYVANGSFIAAALGLGFEAKLNNAGPPNVHFKFSERTVKAPLPTPHVHERTA